MSEQYPSRWHEKYFHSDRIDMLTDGVYAILLTLLVLDLHVPHLVQSNSPAELWAATKSMSHHFWSFFITFLWLASSWLAIQSFSRLLIRKDVVITWIELFMLLINCLYPFPTALMAEYPHNPMGMVYFGVLSVLYMCLVLFLTQYCLRKNFISEYVDLAYYKKINGVVRFLIPLYAVPIGIAFYYPVVAQFIFLLLCIGRIVGTRTWKLKEA